VAAIPGSYCSQSMGASLRRSPLFRLIPIFYQAIDEPPPTPKPAYPELSEFPDESEYAQRPQTPSPYAVSSCTGLASFTTGETIRTSRHTTKLCRSPLLPANQYIGMQSPDSNSNSSRCSEYPRPISSSPPTLFHSAQSDTRYAHAFRQLPSFDAPMQTRISIPSKHRRPNP
jgi:hypothetical protein